MIHRDRRSDVLGLALVGAQVAATGGLMWPGGARWALPRPVQVSALSAVLAGGALALTGTRALGGEFTPFVDPRSGAALRTAGVYSVSRNPIYAGLLLGASGFALLRRRPEPLAAAAVLATVLHVKVGIEEQRLTSRFGVDYTDYASRTPRLLGLPRR